MKITYNYKDGSEVKEGDYIKFVDDNWEPHGRAYKVYKWEDECDEGLGIDATNPTWIEDGRAVATQYGIYPFDTSDRFIKVSEEEALKTIPHHKVDDKVVLLSMTLDFNSMEKLYASNEWKIISQLIDSSKVLQYGTTLK